MRLKVVPFFYRQEHGISATRAPSRPNPIGLSVVELLEVRGNPPHGAQHRRARLHASTRHFKPYIDAFDRVESSRSGWLASSPEEIAHRRSDKRFT